MHVIFRKTNAPEGVCCSKKSISEILCLIVVKADFLFYAVFSGKGREFSFEYRAGCSSCGEILTSRSRVGITPVKGTWVSLLVAAVFLFLFCGVATPEALR